MKKYIVSGTYENKSIDEVVKANSLKQAKLIAGFSSGFGGSKMRGFINSKSVSVSEYK